MSRRTMSPSRQEALAFPQAGPAFAGGSEQGKQRQEHETAPAKQYGEEIKVNRFNIPGEIWALLQPKQH